MTDDPKPTITDADRECARLVLEYVASVTDPRSMIATQFRLHREAAVKEAVEHEREVWRQMWRYQLKLIRAALIDEPAIEAERNQKQEKQGPLTGRRGAGMGRAEWEREYYGDVIRRLETLQTLQTPPASKSDGGASETPKNS